MDAISNCFKSICGVEQAIENDVEEVEEVAEEVGEIEEDLSEISQNPLGAITAAAESGVGKYAVNIFFSLKQIINFCKAIKN